MGKLVNSTLGLKRVSEEPHVTYEHHLSSLIKFENKHGDVMVCTPTEAKEVISTYIHEEFELYADDVILLNKTKILKRLEDMLKEVEDVLVKHLDAKFDEITERMLEATISRRIEEEVDRRLKIIKDKL